MNFEFSNGEPSDTELTRGAALLYVNGIQVAQLHGPSYHLGALRHDAHHEIRVVLANEDLDLLKATSGGVLEDTLILHLSDDGGHSH